MNPKLSQFTNKVQALAEVGDVRAPFFLICRDSHAQTEDGTYTGGKLFRVFHNPQEIYDFLTSLPPHERHLYEHVGHMRNQRLAPYMDVDLLLRASVTRQAQALIVARYRAVIARQFSVPPDSVLLATSIKEVNAVWRDGVLKKIKGNSGRGGAGACGMERVLLFSFHVKVHFPDLYFVGNSEQEAFWQARAPNIVQELHPFLSTFVADPKAWEKQEGFACGVFDHLVYAERPWRLLHCSKISDPTRVLCTFPPSAPSPDQFLQYMVTHPWINGGKNRITRMGSRLPVATAGPIFSNPLVGFARAIPPCYRSLLLAHILSKNDMRGPAKHSATHAWWPRASATAPQLLFRIPTTAWPRLESIVDQDSENVRTGLHHVHALDAEVKLQVFVPGSESTRELQVRATRVAQRLAPHLGKAHVPVVLEQGGGLHAAEEQQQARLTFPSVMLTAREAQRILQDACEGETSPSQNLRGVRLAISGAFAPCKWGVCAYFCQDVMSSTFAWAPLRAWMSTLRPVETVQRGATIHASSHPTAPFDRLLMPYRIVPKCNGHALATHFWPPNGPGMLFRVPEEKWASIEDALWRAPTPPPMISYCYHERVHALQLDIDKCPYPLLDVTRCCYRALRTWFPASKLCFCLEESPPKNSLPHKYGRVTFPHLDVDARTCMALKSVCTVACNKAWPDASLERWADIIDPQSRSARTHHSGKLCKPGEDCRISRVLGFGVPSSLAILATRIRTVSQPWTPACEALLRACAPPAHEDPVLIADGPRAWACPLRPENTSAVTLPPDLASHAASCTEKLRSQSTLCAGWKHRLDVCNGKSTVQTNFANQDIADAIIDTLRSTEIYQAHQFRVFKILEMGNNGTVDSYACFTDCKHCPIRERETREGKLEGHHAGSTHTDNHLYFIVKPDNLTLRCMAKWHKKEKENVPQDNVEVRAKLAQYKGLLFKNRGNRALEGLVGGMMCRGGERERPRTSSATTSSTTTTTTFSRAPKKSASEEDFQALIGAMMGGSVRASKKQRV